MTPFGEIMPDEQQILKPYLYQNGKRVAYITGSSLYNELGLTTQVAARLQIASRDKRIIINRESFKQLPLKVMSMSPMIIIKRWVCWMP